MPKSKAECLREYRERLKANPAKHEEFKRKHREYMQSVRRPISALSEKEKMKLREQWKKDREKKRHKKAQGLSRPEHVCDYCNRSFNRQHNLRTHIENCHLNASCFCDICNQNLGSPAGLQLHLSRGHNRYGQPHPECDICGRIYARKQNIVLHMMTTHLEIERPEIRCNLCLKTFTTDRNLRRHVSMLHNPDFEYLTCDLCKKIFKGKTSLINHIQNLHNSMKDVARCNLCEKSYTNKRNLKRHMETHKQEKIEFKCVVCPKVYTSNQSLKRHLRLHSSGKIDSSYKMFFESDSYNFESMLYDMNASDSFICEICSFTFSEEASLRKHIKTMHTFQDFYNYCKKFLLLQSVEEHGNKALGYNCEFCSNVFNSVYDLKYHMRARHDMEYALATCNVCFHRSYTKEAMMEHKKSCVPPLDAKSCSYCDKLFTDASSLDFHIKVFHPQADMCATSNHSDETNESSVKFKCELCDRVYYSDRSLKHHIKLKHTLDEEVRCQQCDKLCSNQYYLETHMKFVHNNDTWLKCKYCDKQFRTKRNIRRHIEFTHKGIQRYKCVACETLFKEKRSLRKHVRVKHPNSNLFPQCHICKKRFESAKSCKIHLKLLHSFNMNTYPCGACTVSFTSKAALDIHVSTKHMAENEIYKCEECNIIFEGQSRFDRHNESRHLSAPSMERKPTLAPRCVVCDKDFSSRKTLKRHIKTIHEDFDDEEFTNFCLRRHPFTVNCPDCIKNFTDDFYYNVYQNVKHIPDSIIFKCETCKSSYESFEFAVQRYKQNFDLSNSKHYLSELCTAEMSEESQSESDKESKQSSTNTVQVKLEPLEVVECTIKIEPMTP